MGGSCVPPTDHELAVAKIRKLTRTDTPKTLVLPKEQYDTLSLLDFVKATSKGWNVALEGISDYVIIGKDPGPAVGGDFED